MFREYPMVRGCFNSSKQPQYWRQQAAGGYSRHPAGVPTPERADLLETLEQICLKLGRSPTREELVPSPRIELNAAFGSLHNALLRLGRTPSCMQAAKGFRRKSWKRKKTSRQTGNI